MYIDKDINMYKSLYRMNIYQGNNSRFYHRAYDFPIHGLLIRITVQVWNTVILSNKPRYTVMVQLLHRKYTLLGRSVWQSAETSAGYKHLHFFPVICMGSYYIHGEEDEERIPESVDG